MARSLDDQESGGATWTVLTHLLDLLADKGVLTNQDLVALAEAAHQELSGGKESRKKSVTRLKKLRERFTSR
ncbi:MAG TPA: hypothetical protein VEX16_07055 [Methyloceanibacter sp.]|nr:hypothetical protein [Methyloceanibacter sp.]